MRARTMLRVAYLATVLATTACVAPPPSADDPGYSADPSDFDSKADGISSTSPATLRFIDGAKTRLYAQLPTLADATLLKHLTASGQSGVDVHVYVVVPQPGHPATVLASEQLEASGVDITVVRTSQLPGFLALADDALLVAGGSTDTSAANVAAAAKSFEGAIAEDVSGTPPVPDATGTALVLMPDSHAGPLVALILGAHQTIDLEIYQLQSPAVIAALISAHRDHNVAVRVMLEPKTVGSQNFVPVSAQLKAAGITVQPTPPAFDSSRNVDHAKFMVIDGSELVFGSGNMVRSGLGGNPAPEFCNRDFWIRDTRSNQVTQAAQLFAADWKRSSTSGLDLLVLTPDNADQQIVGLIDGAHKHVFVYNQSLNDASTIQSLIAAQNRGVDVRVLLGDQPGLGNAPAPNQAAIDQLTGAGASAGFFSAHYLHGKVIVADVMDHDEAFVGSQNFTAGGLRNNRELGEILASPGIVDALSKQFLADQASPTP
jgi:phosphatidylserine/phosphatidylglycerophosphate/cardiolipin synthase-like enzyme